jgi:hypothetical protein
MPLDGHRHLSWKYASMFRPTRAVSFRAPNTTPLVTSTAHGSNITALPGRGRGGRPRRRCAERREGIQRVDQDGGRVFFFAKCAKSRSDFLEKY